LRGEELLERCAQAFELVDEYLPQEGLARDVAVTGEDGFANELGIQATGCGDLEDLVAHAVEQAGHRGRIEQVDVFGVHRHRLRAQHLGVETVAVGAGEHQQPTAAQEARRRAQK
jgi:hypothetical protein